MNFNFQHIEYLFALTAIPILFLMYFFLLKWKKSTIKKIGDPLLVKELIKNHSSQKEILKFLFIIIAFGIGVFALANPRSSSSMEKINRNGIDVIIALDVSKSMLAQDIKPSRLVRAKQMLAKLIDKLSNDRIGIVVFAGRAYLQMPLTGDHGAAKMYLSAATTDVVPTQGTVISDALRMSYSSFNPKEKKYKSVILISDGEDHDEGALKIATQMADEGIVINTVGIGSPQGTTIIDELTNKPKIDNEGNLVVTKLNETELKSIAEKGHGAYRLFSNTDDMVNELTGQLNTMDKHAVTDDSLINYKNYFQYFLLFTVLLLVIEFFIGERKKIKPSKINVGTIVWLFILSCCIFPKWSISQNPNTLIKKGNEAYEKKDFGLAITDYTQASKINPSNSIAQYNLGNALYKNNNFDESIQSYDNAITNSITKLDKSKAYYNKGVVLQNNKKLTECIDAYKSALKLNPGDDDARQNLQKALQQQKKQNNKNDNNQDDKKPKDEKKQTPKDKPGENNKQPKPQPSKLTQQDAEEKLKALLQQEKALQDKLRKVNTTSLTNPDKDW